MLAAAAVATVVACVPPSAFASGGARTRRSPVCRWLRAWGYYNGPVDGIAGPMTAGGLHAFQRRMGLPTGVADVRTRVKLGPLGTPLFGSRLLERGCFGWDVSVLQFVLRRAHLYNGALDGYLDASTERALRRFQRRVHLGVDGIAGRATLSAIAMHARVPVRPKIVRVAQYFYVVRAGDSLTAIARRFGTSVGALARANHLDSSHYLPIGKRLDTDIPRRPTRVCSSTSGQRGSASTRILSVYLRGCSPATRRSSSRAPGARGVMQLLPTTRQYVSDVVLRKPIPRGRRRRRRGRRRADQSICSEPSGGNQKLALAAWYQGERAVRTNGVYKVTKLFVADVLALRARM